MRVALLVVLASSVAHAQPGKIDAVMKPWSGPKTPGCAVAVTQAGKVTYAKGYGMADLERNVPITAATVFDIGSVSKQVTAATIHLLAAAGKLGLDDDIRKHLPELPALSKTPVTIRRLLHHTGGLRDYTALLVLSGRQIADIATSSETLKMLARQRGVEFEPGARWEYSNTGYFLLAQIVERAGKQPMAEQVRDRLFKPLGMTASLVLDDHARLIPNRAVGYAPDDKGWHLEMSQWEQTGDGAVLTTVGDLAKWDANFADKKVGGAALIDALERRGKLANGTELEYASGLFHHSYRGQPVIEHGGAWAGYRAQLLRFPKLGSVIVLCNAASADPGELSHRIADIVFEKQLGKEPPEPAAPAAVKLTDAELDAWVGWYRETVSGSVAVVRRDTGLIVEAGQTFPLVPVSKTSFRIGPTKITLEFAGTKPKRTAVLHMKPGSADQKFVEVTAYKPTTAELAALSGRFWCPEINAMWNLRIDGGVAVLDGPSLNGAKLDFTSTTDASSPAADVAVSFTRGARGVTGFTMSSGSLRALQFERL